MATALVTGATAGIGAEFARQLAARGEDLILVARDVARLEATAADLRANHGVKVEILPADLSIRSDVDKVAARLEDPTRPVEILVNNAGFGVHIPLTEPDVSLHARAFDVMCLAVLILGGAAGRAMRERGHGLIINTGSVQGWIFTGNYSALKAWVNNYSQSLYNELRPAGVQVTLLAPGWVRTEFHARAGSGSSLPDFVWLQPSELVRECLVDASRGKAVSVPSWKFKVAVALARHVPLWLVRWASRFINASRGRSKG